MLYKWARSEAEAVALQRDGWEPRPGCLTTHHAVYSLLHRKEEDDLPYTPALDYDAAIGAKE